jgi:hypothetical protein
MAAARRGKAAWALAAATAASALFCTLRFNSYQNGTYVDDAQYVILAESLVSGRGYRLINFPAAPIEAAFPPGWPLLLTPLTALAPGNYPLLELLPIALWLASLPLIHRLLAARLKSPILEATLALIALSPNLVRMAGMLMSEAAYLFFSLLALALLETWEKPGDRDRSRTHEGALRQSAGITRHSPTGLQPVFTSISRRVSTAGGLTASTAGPHWLLLAAALAAAWAQLTRTVGLALMLTLALYLLWRRRWHPAAIVTGVILAALAPQVWLNLQNGGSALSPGYQAQVAAGTLGDKATHVAANLVSYAQGLLADAIVPVFGSQIRASLAAVGLAPVTTIGNVLVLALLGLGWAQRLRRPSAVELYVVFYALGILTFWNPAPGSAQPRFLWPLIPFLYLYLMDGLTWLAERLPAPRQRDGRSAVLAAAGLLALLLIARNIQDWRSPVRRAYKDLSVGTTWVRQHADADAVVMTHDPLPDYLYARRQTVPYPAAGRDIDQYFRLNSIDYIIVAPRLLPQRTLELDGYTAGALEPYLAAQPGRFERVFEAVAHNVRVYQVKLP